MADPDEPPSFSGGIGNQFVTIEVGEEKQHFSVHQDLLTANSKFSKAAFEGEFREATTKSIPLLDATMEQFQDSLNWLYFRRLPSWDASDLKGDDNSNKVYTSCGTTNCPAAESRDIADGNQQSAELSRPTDQELRVFISESRCPNTRLYSFADQYDVPTLRLAVVDELWSDYTAHRWSPEWIVLAIAGEHLLISSSLSRLWLDQFVDRYNHKRWLERSDCPFDHVIQQKVSVEFICHVIYGLSDVKHGNPDQGLKFRCAYHEHPQDEASIKVCTEARNKSRKQKRKLLDRDEKANVKMQKAEGLRNTTL